MKWLLVAPPKKSELFISEHPPVGLGYLATRLRELGEEVDILDCVVDKLDVVNSGIRIAMGNPDVVGINVFSQSLPQVKQLIEIIRLSLKDTIILIGGPHPTAVPEHAMEYLKPDYGFRGEAEIPITEFLEAFKKGKDMSFVPGLIWRNGRAISYNPIVEHERLDEFGFPAWDLIKPEKYYKFLGGKPIANIHSSRGCPYTCKFCVKLGTKLRYFSMTHIWDEIEHLRKTYGITHFAFQDEGFSMDKEFVKDFCREAIGKDFTFVAATGLRLSCLDGEMLHLMDLARFDKNVSVGIESAVPRVRKSMNKNLTQEQIDKGLKLLNEYGYTVSANIILGYPGETREEIHETIRWACKNKLLYGASFTPFAPLPGSEATREIINNGELSPDFDYSRLGVDSVLYAPKGMTVKELDKIRQYAVWRFNFRWHRIKYFLHPRRFIIALRKFIRVFFPNWLKPKKWRREL